jgi:uncharacterized protein (TIGR03032 family)
MTLVPAKSAKSKKPAARLAPLDKSMMRESVKIDFSTSADILRRNMSETQNTASETAPPAEPPLRSVHTNTFAQILDRQGMSIAVTTYQAGKLVILRAERGPGGPVVNTHFRGFQKPMGFAWERGRFALGTGAEIWEFHDIPALAPKLDAPEATAHHDAAFLPRTCHCTGDMQIHEMLWVPPEKPSAPGQPPILSELWFINTRFSCLATRSDMYSFVPRWHPPFISALAPEDRCHLNGICLRDGRD